MLDFRRAMLTRSSPPSCRRCLPLLPTARRHTRRRPVLATVAHPAEHALDPAVEEAGHELFAEIKQVGSCSFSFCVLSQHVSRQLLPLLKADRQQQQ